MSDTAGDTIACPFCAEQIRPEAQKCRHCGEWLGAPKDDKNIPKATLPASGGGDSSSKIIIGILVAVLLLGGGYLYLKQRAEDNLRRVGCEVAADPTNC